MGSSFSQDIQHIKPQPKIQLTLEETQGQSIFYPGASYPRIQLNIQADFKSIGLSNADIQIKNVKFIVEVVSKDEKKVHLYLNYRRDIKSDFDNVVPFTAYYDVPWDRTTLKKFTFVYNGDEEQKITVN